MNIDPLQILLVDDDETDRRIFQEAIAEIKIKCVVHTVNNGMELISYLNKPNITIPDLVLLDLNIPVKNSIECLKEIRSKSKFNIMTVAIYSTSESAIEIAETFLYGANVHITIHKDFNVLKQLLNIVVSTTHLYRGDTLSRKNFILKI